MGLIRYEEFPGAETYRGDAFYTAVEFTTLPIPWVYDQLPDELIETSLGKVREKGGTPLRVLVWRENKLFKYIFTVGIYYHGVSEASLSVEEARLGIPIAIAYLIIGGIVLLLGLNLIDSIIKSAKSLIWGEGEGIPWIPITIAVVGVAIGVGYLIKSLRGVQVGARSTY